MATNPLTNFNPVDRGRVGAPRQFTANAGGTTTTIVGTNADASDISVGDVVRLYNSSDVVKTDKAFTVTTKAVDTPGAGSTTITFTPAAGAATASGDYIANSNDTSSFNTFENYQDIASIDLALNTANGTLYTQARLNTMTLNDKLYALRKLNDSRI